VSDGISLALAFTTGLFGALHCLGMCSGIAGGYFVRYHEGPGLGPVLGYHFSRVVLYTALGVAGAAAGRVLVQTGLIGKGQGILMIAAGLLILLLGLDRLGLIPGRRPPPDGAGEPVSIQVRLQQRPSPPRPWMPMLAGALNGLVPCSLVFSVAVKAAATADPLRAGLVMAAFGIGTLPTMAAVSWSGVMIGRKARGIFSRMAGILVVALGLWTLYEGIVFFDIMRGLANWS
jgi:sulfite exporter TauE/SafE